MNSPEVMTLKQAAEFLQLHYQTVYKKVVITKEIPAARVGRVWRVMKKDLVEYLESKKGC